MAIEHEDHGAIRLTLYGAQAEAIADVIRERGRQDRKWGEQNHSPIEWLVVLGEEFGETSQEALRLRFGDDDDPRRDQWRAQYRAELVQMAAVAVAAIESFDRQEARRLAAAAE